MSKDSPVVIAWQYNGCKWRGHKLRVEVAKPAYQVRLQQEWDAEAAAQEKDVADKEEAAAAAAEAAEAEAAAAGPPVLHLPIPGKRRKVSNCEFPPAMDPDTLHMP